MNFSPKRSNANDACLVAMVISLPVRFHIKGGLILVVMCVLLAIPIQIPLVAQTRTNVILVLADDQGFGDLGSYGAKDLRTPNLDALAANGTRMTRFYSCSPVCSPARAGLLTGRYPDRTGILGVLRKHHDNMGMDLQEVTLAEVLTRHGYATGLSGKWHLGLPPKYRPRVRGFQETYGPLCGMTDYYTHAGISVTEGLPNLFRNDDPIQEEGYLTDLISKEAMRFIEKHQQQPFFLYLAYTAPHTPMQAPKAALELFANLGKSNPQRAIYAAMLYQLDFGIGQIREKLKQLHIADRTAIIYLSDQGWHQGGKEGSASNNGGLRGGKYYLTEGGLRVPCIMALPGHPPGVCNTLAINLDLFPTILSLTGCPLPTQPALDGQNLLPYLNSPDPQPDRTLFWRFRDDQIKTGDQWAVRRGPWKALHLQDKTSLYKIDDDEAEQNDLALRYPEQLAGLRAAYEKWTNTLPAIQWQSKMESVKK